jgi:HEAT repeat protein
VRPLRVGIAALLVTARLLAAEGTPSVPLSVDKLIEQLSAKENTVRREAAMQLGKLGPAAKPAVPALIKALSDPDKQVWSAALNDLALLGPDAAEAVPALIEGFDSRKNRSARDRDRRQSMMRAAYALSRIGEVAKAPLIEALKSEDGSARAGAAKALGGMGPAAKEAIPGLVKNLERDQPDERRETIDALALIGKDAIPALGTALDSNDPKVRAGAALVLSQIGKDASSLATKVADVAAKETDLTARAALLSALPKVGVPPARAVELLIAAVKDDNDQIRHAAINAIFLLRSANDRLIPALTALLKDPNQAWNERAAVVIGRLGSAASATVPALLEVARKRPSAQQPYLDALGQIGPDAVPGILNAVAAENPDAITKDHWAVKCLQTIGGEAVGVLTPSLADTRLPVRLLVARALGEFGGVAASAATELLKTSGDADPRVRAAALTAAVNTHAQTLAAVSKTESALKDPSPLVRMTAAYLVPRLGDAARPLTATLLASLQDKDPKVQFAVLDALPSVGTAAEPAVESLRALLAKSDPAARARILAVFGGIGPGARTVLPDVQKQLSDPDPNVRAAAITAFAHIAEPKERLPVLLAALDDPALPVRRAAAPEIGTLADRASEATTKLTPLLQRDDERDFAFDAIKKIKPKSIPDLITMLSDRDLTVKIFAARRLGSIGPEARDAIAPMEAILASKEREEYKKNVVEALKKIKPGQ